MEKRSACELCYLKNNLKQKSIMQLCHFWSLLDRDTDKPLENRVEGQYAVEQEIERRIKGVNKMRKLSIITKEKEDELSKKTVDCPNGEHTWAKVELTNRFVCSKCGINKLWYDNQLKEGE